MPHTPGPWMISKTVGDYTAAKESYILGVRDSPPTEQPVLIGTIRKHRFSSADRVPTDAEQEANARLIAASPKLLAACKAIRDGWGKNLTEPMALLNLAIAEAEERE